MTHQTDEVTLGDLLVEPGITGSPHQRHAGILGRPDSMVKVEQVMVLVVDFHRAVHTVLHGELRLDRPSVPLLRILGLPALATESRPLRCVKLGGVRLPTLLADTLHFYYATQLITEITQATPSPSGASATEHAHAQFETADAPASPPAPG